MKTLLLLVSIPLAIVSIALIAALIVTAVEFNRLQDAYDSLEKTHEETIKLQEQNQDSYSTLVGGEVYLTPGESVSLGSMNSALAGIEIDGHQITFAAGSPVLVQGLTIYCLNREYLSWWLILSDFIEPTRTMLQNIQIEFGGAIPWN